MLQSSGFAGDLSVLLVLLVPKRLEGGQVSELALTRFAAGPAPSRVLDPGLFLPPSQHQVLGGGGHDVVFPLPSLSSGYPPILF